MSDYIGKKVMKKGKVYKVIGYNHMTGELIGMIGSLYKGELIALKPQDVLVFIGDKVVA